MKTYTISKKTKKKEKKRTEKTINGFFGPKNGGNGIDG
jgi:hypothetical protein